MKHKQTMKNMTLAQAYKQQFGKVSYPFEVFDANGKRTYYENSNGYWRKSEYDSKGNETYYETSDGYWAKCEYDANGNETYYENSNGRIEGQKQSASSNQTIEIDGVEYSAEQVRERIAELKPMSDK